MVRIINDNMAVVENVDVFTPIYDDPYIQGKIVACNATNDLFAMGVTNIVSLQAFLAFPKDMPQDIIVGVLKGMNDFMKVFGVGITGGQTITNPCPVLGGICLGVTHPRHLIHSSGARPGDAVLLTKPLGIQPAMRSYRDLQNEKRDALLARFDESELRWMQEVSVRIMTHSNLEVAEAMRSVGVDAATDVTGFGLLGHATNVAVLSEVDILIHRVPVIRGTLELARFFGHRLSEGFGAETAGGMLVFLPKDRVGQFVDLLAEDGLPCWPIGEVVPTTGSPHARLADDVEYIETEFP